MKDAYRPIWVLLFVVAGVAAVVGIARMRNADRAATDAQERIPWTTDFAAARARSTETNKPILIYFTASWCGPCQRMKGTTWADDRVAAAAAQYIPVKVDIDEQGDLARQFGIDGIPHVEVIGPDGTRRLVTSGAAGPDEFL